MSAVSVLVIDWTTTGEPEPTRMLPMVTGTALRRWITGIRAPVYQFAAEGVGYPPGFLR
jgi:hypothetical protein